MSGATPCPRCHGGGYVEVTACRQCPACGGRAVWRRGVHFDHEMRCTANGCEVTFEPGTAYAVRCPACGGAKATKAEDRAMSDTFKADSGIVYEGANRIVVNAGTMQRIVQAWLHEHHSGGPYTVTAVTETGRGLGAQEFEIKFTTETTK